MRTTTVDLSGGMPRGVEARTESHNGLTILATTFRSVTVDGPSGTVTVDHTAIAHFGLAKAYERAAYDKKQCRS